MISPICSCSFDGSPQETINFFILNTTDAFFELSLHLVLLSSSFSLFSVIFLKRMLPRSSSSFWKFSLNLKSFDFWISHRYIFFFAGVDVTANLLVYASYCGILQENLPCSEYLSFWFLSISLFPEVKGDFLFALHLPKYFFQIILSLNLTFNVRVSTYYFKKMSRG